MKFHRAEYKIDKAYAASLRNKMDLFREITETRKNLFLTIITTFGLKQNQYSLELVQNEVTIDALFESSNQT